MIGEFSRKHPMWNNEDNNTNDSIAIKKEMIREISASKNGFFYAPPSYKREILEDLQPHKEDGFKNPEKAMECLDLIMSYGASQEEEYPIVSFIKTGEKDNLMYYRIKFQVSCDYPPSEFFKNSNNYLLYHIPMYGELVRCKYNNFSTPKKLEITIRTGGQDCGDLDHNNLFTQSIKMRELIILEKFKKEYFFDDDVVKENKWKQHVNENHPELVKLITIQRQGAKKSYFLEQSGVKGVRKIDLKKYSDFFDEGNLDQIMLKVCGDENFVNNETCELKYTEDSEYRMLGIPNDKLLLFSLDNYIGKKVLFICSCNMYVDRTKKEYGIFYKIKIPYLLM